MSDDTVWSAAAAGDVDTLKRLVREGADVNNGDYDYRTPLHLAASEGRADAVRYLVEEAGAKVNIKDRFGGTPVMDATDHGFNEVVAFLREKGAHDNVNDMPQAKHRVSLDAGSGQSKRKLDPWQAAARGNVDSLKQLRSDGADLGNADYDRRTPLHLAASEGHLEAVKYLIEECGVNPNVMDRWHDTPLHDAEKHGHSQIAVYLRGVLRRADSESAVKSAAHSRTKTPPKLKRLAQEEAAKAAADHSKPLLGYHVESIAFGIGIIFWEIVVIVLYAVWLRYHEDQAVAAEDFRLYFNVTRDIAVMIFIGFGYLMTFLRRYGFSALGYVFVISALVIQWSVLLGKFAEEAYHGAHFAERLPIGVFDILDGLFCCGAVMISYGAILGKVTPLQMLVMAFWEPIFYWVNFYITLMELEGVDVGGGYTIHMFGCYFGLTVTLFLTSISTRSHPDNTSCYSSDLFAMIGTLFLWVCWPSFNAAVAAEGTQQMRACVNTYLSLTASTAATFVWSRFVGEQRFEMVHIQNSTLAGGVAMGIAAHLNLYPATVIGVGFITGTVSVLGYRFLTPIMNNYLHCQDVCGIHNLHGMPSIIAALVGIFATLGHSQNGPDDVPMPHGTDQPAIQLADIGITIGIAIFGGIFTGVQLWALRWVNPIRRPAFYHDRGFWHLPSDYDIVVNAQESYDDDEQEMQAM